MAGWRIALAVFLWATTGWASAGWADAPPARALFEAVGDPASGPPAAHGGYAGGCVAGAAALPASGEGFTSIRRGRNRFWGHPDLIAFVKRLGAQARGLGWPHGFIVGDLGQPRGGPVSGHASHQSGLDVDVWLRRPEAPVPAGLGSDGYPNFVRADRRGVTEAWTGAHSALVEAAARDPAVTRVIVNPAIKQALCRAAAPADAAWLRKVRPWWRHDGHMHVRLACPETSPGCVAQTPPPPGDGCDATLDWWFSEEALNPKPAPSPSPPRRGKTLADLPAACAALVGR